MNTTEKFQDYKTRPTELVGRWVKYETRYATGILKISRVTPTQIVLENGAKVNFDGRMIGSHLAIHVFYELLTEQGFAKANKEIAEAKEQRELTTWLDEMARSRQPLTVLRAMKNAVDELIRNADAGTKNQVGKTQNQYLMPKSPEFNRFVIIDAVFVQNALGGGSYVTVWAKSPNFGNSVGIEHAPIAESIEQATAINSRPFITHQFAEFENPDWSETKHSPANNGQIIMICPKNYERAGFLYADAD